MNSKNKLHDKFVKSTTLLYFWFFLWNCDLEKKGIKYLPTIKKTTGKIISEKI